ncbi:MAG: hypothetical protein H0V61_05820 [Chitinophagales bacterium]|nr:hypothetical protein [Chitinophagales bacterium]
MTNKRVKSFLGVISLLSLIGVAMIISFKQYLVTYIDGDVISIVLPLPTYTLALTDPFGLHAILKGETYGGAGRWFCHWTLYTLFHDGYFLIKKFSSDDIQSLFLTSALFQWFCHWLMVVMIALYANMHRSFSLKFFLISCVLAFPFFQLNHWYANAAIIDLSVTYTAFYGFPLALLMLFFYPFFRSFFLSKAMPAVAVTISLIIGLFLIFSGPLIPVLGIFLSGVLLALFYLKSLPTNPEFHLYDFFRRIKKMPLPVLGMLPAFLIMWAYAFYIGRFNSENITSILVFDRYKLMLSRAPSYFFHYGLPFWYALVIMQFIYLRRFHRVILKTEEFRVIIVIGIMILMYLLLLPLGGYRHYRPDILRYDVTMPFTIFLIVVIISGTLFLLQSDKIKFRIPLLITTLIMLLISWLQNFPIRNTREEQELNLQVLANAKTDTVILLPYSSNFFSWQKIEDPSKSIFIRQMIYEWGITDLPIVFYQK